MKTLNNFFSWLFADFFFSLYEMAENKFTLQITTSGKKKAHWLPALKPWVLIQNTGDEIPTQINSNKILYHFAGTFGSYNVYVLPGLPQAQINTIGKYASNLTDGSQRNLLGLGAVS